MMTKKVTKSKLREILSPIPQDLRHHPEGDVFTHTRMVRNALGQAEKILRRARADEFCLTNLDFYLEDEEVTLLCYAAWMHDIGKIGATTLNIDGHHVLYNQHLDRFASWGRWQAINHELPQFFKPQMRKLEGTLWEQAWNKAKLRDKVDLFFIIKNHMRFSIKTAKSMVDNEGRYKDERRIKLLLVLMIMDCLGRGEETNPLESALERIQWFAKMAKSAKAKINHPQSNPAPNDPIAFIQALSNKPYDVIRMAFKGKFGREATTQELESIQ